jgi:hypothetical protein
MEVTHGHSEVPTSPLLLPGEGSELLQRAVSDGIEESTGEVPV